MILVLDNRDSFVFNLDQRLRALGCRTVVRRSDRATVAELLADRLDAIVLSPGPGRPEDAGCLADLVQRAPTELPILGVCLGHQALAAASGASIVGAPCVVHGRCSLVDHDGRGVFRGAPNPFPASRYHSLVVDPSTLGAEWEASAWTTEARSGERVLMAMRHRWLPRVGLQFHPESFRTPAGAALLARFVATLAEVSRPGHSAR